MQIQSINPNNKRSFGTSFTLSKSTISSISKMTKLSEDEMKNLSPDLLRKIMIERGAIKQQSKIKQILAKMYKSIGKRLGLIKAEYHI